MNDSDAIREPLEVFGLDGVPADDERTLVMHDLEFVLESCPRVVVVDEGRVVADGPARALLADRSLMEAHGLERPPSLNGEAD